MKIKLAIFINIIIILYTITVRNLIVEITLEVRFPVN